MQTVEKRVWFRFAHHDNEYGGQVGCRNDFCERVPANWESTYDLILLCT